MALVENPRVSVEMAERMVMGSDPATSPSFLEAVDTIQRLIDAMSFDSSAHYRDESTLNDAHSVMQLAMYRMEEEFRSLLEENSESVDPDWLFDTVANPSFGDDVGSPFASPEDSAEADEELATSHSISDMRMLLDMLPEFVVSLLTKIAVRMITNGYKIECCHVYIQIRKSTLEESLSKLGVEKFTIEEVHKMPWGSLEGEIVKWMKALKMSVGVLLSNEKRLCEQVFPELPSVSEWCFGEVGKAPMMHLLNFAEAVAICRRSPEKLPRILDMYEELRDLLHDINSLFSGPSCENLRSEAAGVLQRLAEAAGGTFVEFANAIRKDTARNPVPGGAVHPLTRYVMNYIRYLLCFSDTLNEILGSQKRIDLLLMHIDQGSNPGSPNENSLRQQRSESPLSLQIKFLMNLLEENLEVKSKLYKDSALAFLFLMNNYQYIVQKVKMSELRTMLSDDWLRREMSKVRQSHNGYLRAAWGRVLQCLRDEGIHSSGGSFSSGVSRTVLKERFKAFNAAFEEVVKIQQPWIVSDPQLRADLRISIVEMVLPAYRAFLGRFHNHLESERHPEKYIKYSAEDMEAILNDLFEEGATLYRTGSAI